MFTKTNNENQSKNQNKGSAHHSSAAEHVTKQLGSRHRPDGLKKMEERPWASSCFGKGISPHYLAKLLKPFGVNSCTIRFGDETTAKGYYRDDLKDPLERYPLPRSSPETCVTS